MISIEITEEVEDRSGMVDLLRHIAEQLEKTGVTTGYYPHWSIKGEEEKSEVFAESFHSMLTKEQKLYNNR